MFLVIGKLIFLCIAVVIIFGVVGAVCYAIREFLVSCTNDAKHKERRVRVAKQLRDQLDRQIAEDMKDMDWFTKRKLKKHVGDLTYDELLHIGGLACGKRSSLLGQ